MRRLLFFLPVLAMCQVTPEITTNIQVNGAYLPGAAFNLPVR